MKAWVRLKYHFDWPLFAAVLLLCVVGVLNLRSATISTRMLLARDQLIMLGVGLVAMVCVMAFDYRILNRLAYWIYGVGLLSLLMVLFLGKEKNGSQRWLEIWGSLGFQPSEFMKLMMIVALAKYLHDDPVVEGRSIKHMLIPFVVLGIPMVLILVQPDLGTAMLFFLIFISVMLLTKLKLRSFVTLLLIAVVSLPVTWVFLLKPYQKDRIHIFLNPEKDPLRKGYHARQSVIAVGSGQLLGKGYMQGTQNLFHFVPERWTDFPYAVWAEEWGFVGSITVLLLELFIVLWAVKLASEARDRFGAVLAVGVASLFFWHTVINMAMVTKMMPVVGVTLPLMSKGGSSLITMLMAVGLLMNVSIRRSSF